MSFLFGSLPVVHHQVSELEDLAKRHAEALHQDNQPPSEALKITLTDIDATTRLWESYSWPTRWFKRKEFSVSVEELRSQLEDGAWTPSASVIASSSTPALQQTLGRRNVSSRRSTASLQQIITTLPPATRWLSPAQIKALPRIDPNGTELSVTIKPGDSAFSDSGVFTFYKGEMEWSGRREVVAIKRQMRDHQDRRDLTRLDREIKIWWELDHPHILPAYGWQYWDSNWIEIIMPYIPNKDVATYLAVKTKEGQDVHRFKLIIGLARAIEYLHAKGIVHGLLEPRCVLVGEGDVALLTNFSAAKYIDPDTLVIDFTRSPWAKTQQDQYVPPERGQEPPNIGSYSDVWSWGLIGYFIMTGTHPWPSRGSMDYRARALAGDLPQRGESERWKAYPELWSVLESCWIHKDNVSKRRPMKTIVRQLEKFPQPWTA